MIKKTPRTVWKNKNPKHEGLQGGRELLRQKRKHRRLPSQEGKGNIVGIATPWET